MPLAISLKAANDTAEPIRALWDEVGRFEDGPSMRALAYPPHITLAVYDELCPDRLRSALKAAFAGGPALRIRFERIGRFGGPPLVLWAAPSPCALLDRAHALVHGLIDPALCHPHYRPGAWVPHCTLGRRVEESRRGEALAFARGGLAPVEVLFDRADAVRFPPVTVLEECGLAPQNQSEAGWRVHPAPRPPLSAADATLLPLRSPARCGL